MGSDARLMLDYVALNYGSVWYPYYVEYKLFSFIINIALHLS